jgi:hypothetical protein
MFRFNIAHIDGHVDDGIWMDSFDVPPQWWGVSDAASGWTRPYGWRWKPNKEDGVVLNPNFELAFDENK